MGEGGPQPPTQSTGGSFLRCKVVSKKLTSGADIKKAL